MRYKVIKKGNRGESEYSRLFMFLDSKEVAEYLGASAYAVKKAFDDGSEINGYFIDCIDRLKCWETE